MSKKKKLRPTFIREWRKFRSLNQEQLASRIGVEQATISRLERGQIAYTQQMLEMIAEALSCSPADLIMRDPTRRDAIWSIWDLIPDSQREQATRVLEAFTRKTGTDG